MKTRPLTADEIDTLVRQSCTAVSWDAVRVHPGFSPEGKIAGTAFSGAVTLGVFDDPAAENPADPFPAVGIRRAHLHNAVIGDNCRIEEADIGDTDVEAGCVVYKTASISHEGVSRFGNGSFSHIVAEDGARAVPLSRILSAQWAHIILHLKNTPIAAHLERLVAMDANDLQATRSRIGAGSVIRHAGVLRNIHLGSGTVIEGVSRLVDCMAVSSPAAPAVLGEGVSAEDCVFLQGSRTRWGVRLEHCLVGEGVLLDHAFFAKHSLFFANSEFTLGESACAMAGPFAVSHHRATLILTCQCSFNTFGSAANSSNHHFKLGPRHGGILRRGTRCGSGSYLFWPCDIGAFSTVIGKHMHHLDTVAFPFSLLTVSGDQSILVPGVNLFSAGLFRDERKWPLRDRRSGIAVPRDLVNPAVMSPYAMQFVLAGLRLLRNHLEEGNEGSDLRHGGALIPATRVESAIVVYESAFLTYMGDCLLSHLPEEPVDRAAIVEGFTRILQRHSFKSLRPATSLAWRDWGGMLLSGMDARDVLADLENGVLTDPEAVDDAFASAHARYRKEELRWLAAHWLDWYGDVSEMSMAAFLDALRDAAHFANARLLRDAAKEFSADVTHGFGVESPAAQSFLNIRGQPDADPTIQQMQTPSLFTTLL